MPSAISATSVPMVSPSERERVAEDTGAGSATGEDADELDGVELDPLAASALAELATGRTLEDELEGLTVDLGPLAHDVGHEPAVVVGGQLHRPTGRAGQVDAVRPHVTSEPDVEQV